MSTRRSTPASPSSTPPTSTAPGQVGGVPRRGAGRAPRRRRAGDQVRPCRWTSSTSAGRLAALHHAARSKPACSRLQTDYIDLYQFHAPDPPTPIEETLARAGRPRDPGQGPLHRQLNFSGWQIADADARARTRGLTAVRLGAEPLQPAGAQRRARADARLRALRPRHPAVLPAGVRPADRQVPARRGAAEGARIAAGQPGALNETNLDTAEALATFAGERGNGILEVAFGWLPGRAAVGSVIAGASPPEQVRTNAAAIEWQPSAADLAALDAIVPPPLQDLHRQRPAWTR